jgi:hypothetical protein
VTFSVCPAGGASSHAGPTGSAAPAAPAAPAATAGPTGSVGGPALPVNTARSGLAPGGGRCRAARSLASGGLQRFLGPRRILAG